MIRHAKAALAGFLLLATTAMAADEPAPEVYFISPQDGARVTSPVHVVFGLRNFGIAPAGVDKPNTGHHHLLIDTTLAEEERGFPIPADARHRHFGGGQTETLLELAPGTHRLQLVLGDANHIPLDPPVDSEIIAIHVE